MSKKSKDLSISAWDKPLYEEFITFFWTKETIIYSSNSQNSSYESIFQRISKLNVILWLLFSKLECNEIWLQQTVN